MAFFTEKGEIDLVAIVLEDGLECGSDGAFVLFSEVGICFEFGVVCFDGLVRRFDVEMWHSVFSRVLSVIEFRYRKLYTNWGRSAR